MSSHTTTTDSDHHVDRVVAALDRLTGDRAEIAAAFARAALRRVPDRELAELDVVATATWLQDAFAWVDQVPAGTLSVRLWHPTRDATRTVVEVTGPDRPFLLSTVTRTIETSGAQVASRMHPIFGAERDDHGHLVAIGRARHADLREVFLHLELDRMLDQAAATDLLGALSAALQDLWRVTDDHDAMRAAVAATADRLLDRPVAGGQDDPAAVAALLRWFLDDNLVLLGSRSYHLTGDGDDDTVVAAPDSALGILREVGRSRFHARTRLADIDPKIRERLTVAPLLRVTRTTRRSTVHRLRPMLDVLVTTLDANGTSRRVDRILGLFTAAGLGVPAARTPVLADRLQQVLEAEDVVPGSHEEITLVGLFQSLPKDELLELTPDGLRHVLVALLDAEEHGRVRAVVRTDEPTSTVTVVLAVPRDDYAPAVRRTVTAVLSDRLGRQVDADVSMGEHTEVIARFTASGCDLSELDLTALEQAVVAAAQPWLDRVQAQLTGEPDGHDRQVLRVAARLPASYRERTNPRRGVIDAQHIAALLEDEPAAPTPTATPATTATWVAADEDGTALLVARCDQRVALSDVMPVLESLGMQVDAEHPHVLVGSGPDVYLHEYRVRDPDGQVARAGQALTDTVLEALAGRFEVDGLNRLVLAAGLTWQQVAVVRAYRRYRRQVGTSYSAEYTNAALADHAEAVRAILEYFRSRFDPAVVAEMAPQDHVVAVTAARAEANAACDAIERLDHDRIVRGILHLVDATLRTTAYLDEEEGVRGWTHDADGRRVPVLAFKFDPSQVPDAPAPLPHREVFVSSPAVEGIHLRGGPIARGGLRFSDRHDDLRTEVLGLMKAQMLKNALIVPTGAKGGFVCKRLPAERDQARADVQRQYEAFIGALLDLTDNLEADGTVVPPTRVVRQDGDDPYLVVAADKGTATFSDVANRVAQERGFWLGDAFASGGSSGYDHKGLGITARGAWTVITRHFTELDHDLATDPTTVVGVGDMSGDVFGNGMLLSRSLRLLGAFDHRDVIVDPDPDPAVSFGERQRLYDLPGSSWQDYDRQALSEGGMVVSRAAKSVQVTPQVRDLLGLVDVVTPAELIRALLCCQVDLMWFGGIGTYVKAPEETAADVGDRVNDEVRVDATEVRARVIGEGANLAVTQRGRVTFARRGGRIDQDAVHNAAGVDISDHEVNLKILLRVAEAEGRMDRATRNTILADVSEDVVDHVLRDVDRQAAQLSRLAASSAERLDDLRELIDLLEQRETVDRHVDVLPDDEELDNRAEAGGGLTRPELATLMAGAKRVIGQTLLQSELPDDPVVGRALVTYVPPQLLAEFADLLPRHQLRRELVATITANDLVDRLGPSWPFHLSAETGSELKSVLAATLAAWHVVDATTWWGRMDELDTLLLPARAQPLAADLARLVANLTRRLLDDPLVPDVAAVVARDRDAFEALRRALPTAGTATQVRDRRAVANRLMDDLVDPDLAQLLAGLSELGLVVEVARTARDLAADPAEVAAAMLPVAATLGLDRLATVVERTRVRPGWERRERKGLAADVQRLHAAALREAVTRAGDLAGAVEAASTLDPRRTDRVRTLLADVESLPQPPLTAVSVAVRAFSDLLQH